jgi:hypothetical protein
LCASVIFAGPRFRALFAGGISAVLLAIVDRDRPASRPIILTNAVALHIDIVDARCIFASTRSHYTFATVLILLLIVALGALGTFVGIITVILKNERTTNRHHLLSNIPGSIALGAVVCVVPGGLAYVLTDSIAITAVGALVAGFIVAWLIEALDH